MRSSSRDRAGIVVFWGRRKPGLLRRGCLNWSGVDKKEEKRSSALKAQHRQSQEAQSAFKI